MVFGRVFLGILGGASFVSERTIYLIFVPRFPYQKKKKKLGSSSFLVGKPTTKKGWVRLTSEGLRLENFIEKIMIMFRSINT